MSIYCDTPGHSTRLATRYLKLTGRHYCPTCQPESVLAGAVRGVDGLGASDVTRVPTNTPESGRAA